jgi:hypothetical protein
MSDDFSGRCLTCKAELGSVAGQDFRFCPSCGARLPDSSEQKIFDAARELESDRRKDFLDSVCGNDSALRNRIEALLAAHSFPDSLLDLPATGLPPTDGDSTRSTEYSLPADTQIGEHKNEATALKIAEKTGASSAWILMIKGLAALYRDETERGVSLFRQALEQEPSNLSCKSMLCLAHLTSGDLRPYLILKDEIATATPRNQDEQMYSAHALFADAVAYPRIASVIESHDSPVANVIFADVVDFHANATGDTTRVAVNDPWCVACKGVGFIDCEFANCQMGVVIVKKRVQVAVNGLTREPIYGNKNFPQRCPKCGGKGGFDCPHCQNGRVAR